MPRTWSAAIGLTLFATEVLAATPKPSNDHCGSAIVITALPFRHDEPASALAARAVGDPSPSCNGGRAFNSTWFSYTAAVSQRVVLTTRTSWDDTFLWVGTGACGSLTEVACADDNVGSYNAEVQFLAAAGTTYYFLAGSTFPSGDGQINLIVEDGDALNAPPPPNDDCLNATPIGSPPQVLTSTGYGATEELGDLAPPCWPGADNYTLWYSLTSPVERQVRLDTTNSTEFTWLTVATGRCDQLVPIDCDWTSGVNSHGVVDFRAKAGVTYHIQVSRHFPAYPGDVVELAVSDGQSVPIAAYVTDAVSGQAIENAHVQVRDVWGGYYLMREGWTNALGRLNLYVVTPDTYSLQIVAQGHEVWSQQFTMGSTPLQFDVALRPFGPIAPVPEEPTRIVVPEGLSLLTFLPDGSDPRVIDLPGFTIVRYPTWSPDAAQIAFMGFETATGFNEIWIVNADGTGLRRVTDFQGDPFAQVNLAWSPDGQEFAFDWQTDPFSLQHSIHVVDARTGGNLRVFEWGERPRWSPDSSMIAYIDAWGPRVMRRDGSNVATLNEFVATGLDWSPDGTRIAVSNGNTDIWAIPIDGRNPLKVSAAQGNTQLSPVWSPDACEIAYYDNEVGVAAWNVAWADGAGFHSPMPLLSVAEADWARHPAPVDAPGDRGPRVNLTDPNGGELMEVGLPYTIHMPAVDDGGVVSRDIHLEVAGTWTTIASGLPGALDDYTWTVASAPTDSSARLRVVVRDAQGQEHSDISKYPFSIAGPADDYHRLKITAPVAGQRVEAGDILRITWDYDERTPFTSDGFHLELSLDGGNSYRAYIHDFIDAADRAYDWTVPDIASGDAVVRIRSNGAYDESGVFVITGDAVETRGRSSSTSLILFGVRSGSDAVFSWAAPGTTVNVHRGDSKLVLPALGAAPPVGASSTGTWSDPDPVPGLGLPWFYQVFVAACGGSSLP